MAHSNTTVEHVIYDTRTPLSGQYLTHAPSHITRADPGAEVIFHGQLFRPREPHQHSVAELPQRVQNAPLSASSTQHLHTYIPILLAHPLWAF